MGGYNSHGVPDNASGIQRLNSQLSFTRQDSLSQITEESEDADDDIHAEGRRKATHSFATASFGMGSWDNSSNITFSGGPGKRAKNDNGGGLNITESQVLIYTFSNILRPLALMIVITVAVGRVLNLPAVTGEDDIQFKSLLCSFSLKFDFSFN